MELCAIFTNTSKSFEITYGSKSFQIISKWLIFILFWITMKILFSNEIGVEIWESLAKHKAFRTMKPSAAFLYGQCKRWVNCNFWSLLHLWNGNQSKNPFLASIFLFLLRIATTTTNRTGYNALLKTDICLIIDQKCIQWCILCINGSIIH